MKMKIIAGLAFLLNTFLYGSYYSVAKDVLGHADPIVFTFLTMMTLVPPALIILAFTWRNLTREAIKSAFMLGSCLCLGLFTLAVALKYNSATGTAFFPSLNGLLAAIFAWAFLRQPIGKGTWFAALVSVTGAIMLMANASMGGLRGALIAFIGGMFCTFYIFLADREQKDEHAYAPFLAIELLTMALWANLITLLFGDWQVTHFALPKDGFVVLYIGLGTIFLPTLITVLLQKYISPVTVSFITILEPLLGAMVAFLYLREVLPLDGYLGGGLVCAGALMNTWSTRERPTSTKNRAVQPKRIQTTSWTALIYPVVCCAIGFFLIYRLGGFPPYAWYQMYQIAPQLSTLLQQGQGVSLLLLSAQALSWLLAWVALLLLAALASYRLFTRFSNGSMVEDTETTVQLDVRTLRQMGYTPYTMAAANNKPYNEKEIVQKRRLNRQMRLSTISNIATVAGVEPVAETAVFIPEPFLPRHNPTLQTRYHDTAGNQWLCWDDLSVTEVRER